MNNDKVKLWDLGQQICEEAQKYQSEFTVQLGGHNKRGTVSEWYVERKVVDLWVLGHRCNEQDLKRLLGALHRRGHTQKPIKFGKSCLDCCYICGRQIGITFDGKTFGAETVCPYPDGLPEYSMTLAVPSGKLVAGNDFRDAYGSEEYDVDSDIGCRRVFMFYAKRGMAHGIVGNTCPGVYRIDDKTLTISQCRHENHKRIDLPGERVGGICTDLWWYSLADYDDLAKRYGRDPSEGNDVIDVKPGTYRVTHRAHKVDRDANVTDHYAIIKRVR